MWAAVEGRSALGRPVAAEATGRRCVSSDVLRTWHPPPLSARPGLFAPMAVVPGRLAVYANADARSSAVVAAQMSAADGDRAMLNGLHQVYGAATRRAVVRMITEAADGVLELLATRG